MKLNTFRNGRAPTVPYQLVFLIIQLQWKLALQAQCLSPLACYG